MTLADSSAWSAGPIFADALPGSSVAPGRELPDREWTWTNWALSLLTAPAAVLMMAWALTRVAGTAVCNRQACPGLPVNGSLFGLLYHGAAAVAALTLLGAFFFAPYRLGSLVWVSGWALLGIDIVVLLMVF